MKPIILSASKSSWAVSVYHGTNMDKDRAAVRSEVLKRDGYACMYCDFKAEHYQEIHHLDGNHDNNSPANLTTVCPLCHQAFHLLNASMTGGGKIIYLPEISQVQLNHLCRAIFVTIANEKNNEEMAGNAKSLLSSLESRSNLLESDFVVGSSDPGTFAEALIALQEDGVINKVKNLEHFKLLPSASRFGAPVEYWGKIMFNDFPSSHWEGLLPPAFDAKAFYEKLQASARPSQD